MITALMVLVCAVLVEGWVMAVSHLWLVSYRCFLDYITAPARHLTVVPCREVVDGLLTTISFSATSASGRSGPVGRRFA
jgi:hypothetical protein